MPQFNVTLAFDYEHTASDSAIALVRDYVAGEARDILEDELNLAFVAMDTFGVPSHHPGVAEALKIFSTGGVSDSFEDPFQEALLGAEAWT